MSHYPAVPSSSALHEEAALPAPPQILHEVREGQKSRAAFSRRDVAILAKLPLFLLISWALPQRRWPLLARLLGEARPELAVRIRAALADSAFDAEAIATRLEANRVEHSFQYLREYRPGGWRFSCVVEGFEHIAQAQADGRGVVLWMSHFVFHGLAAKKLLRRGGFPVHHVSRPEHGFSKTEFGIRFLNPIRVRVEDRYLASRVLIGQRSREELAAHLGRLLRGGEVISITAGAWEGRRIAWVPFLGGRYPLATGAPSLAHAHGAALIPVFCWRGAGEGGRLTLRIGRPIDPPAGIDRRGAIDFALREFMARHEEPVGAAAAEWRGWYYMHP